MYFSQVRVDPNDPDVVFYAGVKLHRSLDGGKTVTLNATQTIHDGVAAIWIDPSNSNHVMIGNDGGLAQTWDQAKTWIFIPNLPVGLFYHVSVDMATPFNVCGGMQDNYDWCGPSQVRGARRHRQLPLAVDSGRRRLRRPPGSERLPHRLQRNAGRQHRPRRSDHRRDDVDPAAAGAGRARAALALGHAAGALAARSEGRVRGGAEGVPIARSRPVVDGDQRRPHERRESRRHRDDGAEEHRHHHRATTASSRGRRSWRSRSRRRRPACSTRAPTTGICRCRGMRGRTGRTSSRRFRTCRRGLSCRASSRRGSKRAPSTRRSTAIGRTTSRPTSTRATTTARRGGRSRRISRATSS